MKILGHEPALIIGVVVALISLGGTLGFSFLSMDQAGLWIAGVNAIAAAVLAWTTRPLSPGVFTAALGALVALGTGYGLQLTGEQVNGINGLLVPILLLVTRNQVTPQETALTSTTEAAGKPEVQTVPEG